MESNKKLVESKNRENPSKIPKQFIKCVKDANQIFYDQILAVTGLEPEAIERVRANFGFPIYPGYEVKVIGNELWVGKLHAKLSDISFVYDFVGIPETIRQRLIDAGCHYRRRTFQKGWLSQKRMDPARAVHVDLIRLSNSFTNLFFQGNIQGRLALVLALQGLAADDRLYQDYLDAIGDAFLLGYHCHLAQNCNLAEANAARVTWELTNQLLRPFGLGITNRVADRLYRLKRMLGNFRTMARSPADALFNLMYIFCEEEMWKLLTEKGIDYLGVGGFAHFSYYSDLAWMGLVLDLCEQLKFAGHVKLVLAILNERIDPKKVIARLHGFKNELLYTVTAEGQRLLFELKEELFEEPNYFYGKNQSFRETIVIFVESFDELLWKIGHRFDKEYLLVKEARNPFELPAKLWRLTLEWENLQAQDKEKLQKKAFTICQEEIRRLSFKPLVWLPSQAVARRVDEEVSTFKEFSFLFEEREQELMKGREQKFGRLSPSVYRLSQQCKELTISWIN